MKKLKNESQY